MASRVLILGASGRFGRHAVQAFTAAGWHVRGFDRGRDTLRQAAQGTDVIVNAWNPPDYTTWARDLLSMHERVIEAARLSGATILVPGNVYVFGADTPGSWGPNAPYRATHPLGRLRREMEARYKASGVRTIVLRGGDFLDTEPTESWFDKIIAPGVPKGVLSYPGPLECTHTWAFLPDMARAAEQLARTRATLAPFCDVAFPGYALTGADLHGLLEHASGRPLRLKQMNWLPLYVLKTVMPSLRGLIEMRYLWTTPHRLDRAQFDALLPEFQATPPVEALRRAIAHLPMQASAAPVTA